MTEKTMFLIQCLTLLPLNLETFFFLFRSKIQCQMGAHVLWKVNLKFIFYLAKIGPRMHCVLTKARNTLCLPVRRSFAGPGSKSHKLVTHTHKYPVRSSSQEGAAGSHYKHGVRIGGEWHGSLTSHTPAQGHQLPGVH